MLYASMDVQAADNRLRGVPIVRVAGRRQRRPMLHLRPAQSRASGALRRCCGRLGTTFGFISFVVYGCAAALCRHLDRDRRDWRERHAAAASLAFCRQTRWSVLAFGESGAVPVFYYPHVVDDPERGMAARRSAAYFLQHVWTLRQLGPATADIYGDATPGDHLHDRREPRDFF